jgi:hypothetical protein
MTESPAGSVPRSLQTAADVARRLRCTPATVYNLARCGELPAVKWRTRGGRDSYRWQEEQVSDFILKHLQAERVG